MIDFEKVMSGLLAYLQAAVPDFGTVGRRVKHWNEVAAQPALFLRRIGMMDQHNGSMQLVTMECELWIYCNAGQNPDTAPDTDLTRLEMQVRAAFAPDDGSGKLFTIGGLVHWCRIEGRTHVSPGDQGPQAISILPVRITLPF